MLKKGRGIKSKLEKRAQSTTRNSHHPFGFNYERGGFNGKISTPRLPEARKYSREQLSQLIQTLDQVIFILNNKNIPKNYVKMMSVLVSFVLMPNVYTNHKAKLANTNPNNYLLCLQQRRY